MKRYADTEIARTLNKIMEEEGKDAAVKYIVAMSDDDAKNAVIEVNVALMQLAIDSLKAGNRSEWFDRIRDMIADEIVFMTIQTSNLSTVDSFLTMFKTIVMSKYMLLEDAGAGDMLHTIRRDTKQ